MPEILRLTNVRKSFGGIRAVDGISLTIREGSLTGLVGPNGSGKSTLFNVISGLLKADEGEIYFKGERLNGLPPHKIFEKGLTKTFQDSRPFLGMSVLDNLLVPPRNQLGEKPYYSFLHTRWKKQEINLANKAREILELLELIPVYDKFASEISAGQMKLLELGRALMGNPRLLLLDEPTAGIAPKLARVIFKKICILNSKQNLTFFIIEHRLRVLFHFVKDIYVMNKGRIIAHGTPQEIIKNEEVADVYLGG